nr:DUF3152 domain-containing protein [uncultured Actinoplanes sp.]
MIIRRVPGRRRWWLLAFLIVLLVPAGFAASSRSRSTWSSSAATWASPSVIASPSPSPSPAKTAGPPPTPVRTEPLQLPGGVPAKGSGSFAYAAERGPVHGTQGRLRRFRVAVEKGSNEDPVWFARQVDATLGDARSWTGGGTLRLQMVAGTDRADFTVYLATRETAGRLCERGGTNIRIGGRPYTSCRTVGKVIINLDRWRLSSRPFLTARVPLATYRRYVLNHEVGHELGRHHQGCPKRGGPAPVMVQQTLTTRGCVPYAWPRRGSSFLVGPPL